MYLAQAQEGQRVQLTAQVLERALEAVEPEPPIIAVHMEGEEEHGESRCESPRSSGSRGSDSGADEWTVVDDEEGASRAADQQTEHGDVQRMRCELSDLR